MRLAKCEAKARYHKVDWRPRPKKVCEAEAELYEAVARDAVLTINY